MNINSKNFIKQKLYIAFTNPVFYITALLFNVFCAFQFFYIQNFFSGTGSADLHYFFSIIPYILIIIVPVLCIKLQGSRYEDILPFSHFFRFFASWLAVFIQFCAMLVPQISVPLCVNLFGDVDIGQVSAGFLIIILYAAAAVACAQFFFFVLQTNTVAFIFSSLLLSVSNSAHIISGYAATSSFIMKLVRTVSFSWHFDRAAKGIIDSRDIFYYLAVFVMFFGFSVFFLEKKASRVYSKSQKVRNILAAVIFIFFCLDASKYYFRIDLSKSKKYTVSEYTKKLVDSAEGASQEYINITYYRSDVLLSLYPQTRDIYDFLVEFASGRKISVLSVDADRSGISSVLENYGITSRQLQTAGNNRTEFSTVYSSVVVEYGGKWEIIPFVLSCDTLEYDLCVRLKRLITGNTRSAAILCGNGLSLKNDYSYVVPWLSAQGFSCNEINLSDGNLDWQLEQSCKYGDVLLVLGSDKFSDEDCLAIENYIENGKKVLFAVSPYQADIEKSWYITKSSGQKLLSMLENFGAVFSNGIINDISCVRITMESDTEEDGSPAASVHSMQINYFPWISLLPQTNARQGMTLFWPVGMECTEQSVTPLLTTTSAAYEMQPDNQSPQSLFETNPFILSQAGYNPAKSGQKTRVCAVRVDGRIHGFYNAGEFDGAEFEIIPDQYFVHSLMLGYAGGMYGDYRNLDFMTSRLLLLNGEGELAALYDKRATSGSQLLYKVPDGQSFSSARSKSVFCLFVLTPVVIISAGLLSFVLRKRQIKKYSGG